MTRKAIIRNIVYRTRLCGYGVADVAWYSSTSRDSLGDSEAQVS